MAGVGDELLLFLHILYFRAHKAFGKETHDEEGQECSESQNGQHRNEHAAHEAQLFGPVQVDDDRAAALSVRAVVIIPSEIPKAEGSAQCDTRVLLRLLFFDVSDMACLDHRYRLVLVKQYGKIARRIIRIRRLSEEVSHSKNTVQAPFHSLRKRRVVRIFCIRIAVMILLIIVLDRIRFGQVPIVLRDIAHNLLRLIADRDRAEKVDKAAHDQHDAKKSQRRCHDEPVPDSFNFMFCHKS